MHAQMSGLLAVATFDGALVDLEVAEAMARAAPHLGKLTQRSRDGVIVASQGLNDEPASDESLIVALDGRIDNVQEIEKALAPRDSCEDLLLAAYRRWGMTMFARIVGDFVIAIWDNRRRRLTVARDVMGVRNVYYRVEVGRRVLVATELKQLLVAPNVPCQPNEDTMIADLAGLYALPDMTAYEGINKLPPGHVLSVSQDSDAVRRYWLPDDSQRVRYRGEREYAEHFRSLFAEAVRVRTDAERRTGILLSGGLDSTSIVATAAWLGRRGVTSGLDLRAYTWAFDVFPDGDERPVARAVSTDADVSLTEVASDDLWPLSPAQPYGPDRDDPYVAWFQGLFDRSMATARADGCVRILTADRGDDLVGNWVYDDLGLLLTGRFRAISHDLHAYRTAHGKGTRDYLVQRLVKPLVGSVWQPQRLGSLRAAVVDRKARKPLPTWIPEHHRVRAEELRRAWGEVPTVAGYARRQRFSSIFHPTAMRIAELRQRASARLGLLHADPWSDRRLAEFVLAVPQSRVQRYSSDRHLTRNAMRGIMPDRLLSQTRRGWPASLFSHAFTEREVGKVRDLFTTSRAAKHGWLNAEDVLGAYNHYLQGGEFQASLLYPLNVEVWLRSWWE